MVVTPSSSDIMPVGRDPCVATVLTTAAGRLAKAGVEQPRLDARLLLAHALSLPDEGFFGREEMTVATEDLMRYDALVSRRCAREPVSRILGTRGFWTLDLEINHASLDPRPDSETLIDAVLEHLPDREAGLRVLDLGTGTGCLLLSILTEYPNARGIGIDRSIACVDLAARNAARNNLAGRAQFRPGDWIRGLDAIFDVILSNPPYIPDHEIARLAPEVADHDPRAALDGGADGLACYRRLAADMHRVLAPNGLVFLEIGHDQATAVRDIFEPGPLGYRALKKDLGGRDRCLVFSGIDKPL